MIEIRTDFYHEWMEDDWKELCNKSGLDHESQLLVIKNRNRWRHSDYIPSCPSGMMYWIGGKIRLSIGPDTSRQDFRHVIAHEIGHLIEWIFKGNTSEHGANLYAISFLGCVPKSDYGIKVRWQS